MNLDEYCSKEKKNSEFHKTNNYNKEKVNDKPGEDEIKKRISKYSNMTKEQLLQELINQKRNGKINDEKIGELTQTLMPLLSRDQQEKLNKILEMLR